MRIRMSAEIECMLKYRKLMKPHVAGEAVRMGVPCAFGSATRPSWMMTALPSTTDKVT